MDSLAGRFGLCLGGAKGGPRERQEDKNVTTRAKIDLIFDRILSDLLWRRSEGIGAVGKAR